MFRTSAVFPTDGRAAMMTRSPAWNPAVISSRSAESRRHAGDELLALVRALDGGEARVRQLPHRGEPGAHAIFGDREDRLLGLVENEIGLLLSLVGGRENLVRRENQIPEGRLLAHDARVVLDVGGMRQTVDERRNVGGPADFVELPRSRELFLERDEVDRVSPLAQLNHLLEDPAVRVAVEVARRQNLRGLVEGVVVDQDGARARIAPPRGCAAAFDRLRPLRPLLIPNPQSLIPGVIQPASVLSTPPAPPQACPRPRP